MSSSGRDVLRFSGTLEVERGSGCSLELPAEVITALGSTRVRVPARRSATR